MIYPRGEGIDPNDPRAVAHCVRVAEELGADLIKTNYPQDEKAFRQITTACSVPVLVAGGEKGGDLESLMMIDDAITAGGAGVCMGRNAFQRKNTTEFVHTICRVVHGREKPDKALGRLS
jgi:2-amino-3,7-dideoxy-D-threo-hept-6-ulosonate synthase